MYTAKEKRIPIYKVLLMTTDGAPSTTGTTNVFLETKENNNLEKQMLDKIFDITNAKSQTKVIYVELQQVLQCLALAHVFLRAPQFSAPDCGNPAVSERHHYPLLNLFA
ncbi:hypothetical protein TNCV_780881 [Trichonephila clavipes]|nr:hypothetical protein TNCV_780881 [Trichonephila clavipes]